MPGLRHGEEWRSSSRHLHHLAPQRLAAPRDAAEPTEAQLAAAAGTFALLAIPPGLHLAWLIIRGSTMSAPRRTGSG
jgi:hypothetical protein